MAGKYWVDWDDAAFPRIRPIEEASEYATPQTLGEAKAEIIDHFRHHVDHARMMIRETRALRADDIRPDLVDE